MDIIDERYGENTCIISSQISVSAWWGIIQEGTIVKGDFLVKGTFNQENHHNYSTFRVA